MFEKLQQSVTVELVKGAHGTRGLFMTLQNSSFLITTSGQPPGGCCMQVISRQQRASQLRLLLILPDELGALISADWTDYAGGPAVAPVLEALGSLDGLLCA